MQMYMCHTYIQAVTGNFRKYFSFTIEGNHVYKGLKMDSLMHNIRMVKNDLANLVNYIRPISNTQIANPEGFLKVCFILPSSVSSGGKSEHVQVLLPVAAG